MADQPYLERKTVVDNKSNMPMAFIVGGLVVAVAVVAWFISGGNIPSGTVTSTEPSSTSITIDNTAPPPAVDVQPAPPAVEVQPAPPAETPVPAPAPVAPPAAGN